MTNADVDKGRAFLHDLVADEATDGFSRRAELEPLARLLVADTLACAASGTRVSWTSAAELPVSLRGDGRVPTAGFLAAVAHLEEFDALRNATATIPAIGVAVALTRVLGRQQQLGDLLDAVSRGLQIGDRIGATLDVSHLYATGSWPSSLIGKVAAVAALGHVEGLTGEQLVQAIAISATWGMSALPGTITAAHYVSPAIAARAAELAVELAAAGAVGSLDLLVRPPYRMRPSRATVGGTTDLYSLFKAYPCARPLHSVINCVDRLRSRTDLTRGILRITLPIQVAAFVNADPSPASAVQRRCSAPYVAELAARGRAADPTAYAGDVPPSRTRVEVVFGDDLLDGLFPDVWGCRVEIGSEVESETGEGPARSREEQVASLTAKWRSLTSDQAWLDRLLLADRSDLLNTSFLPVELVTGRSVLSRTARR